MLVVDDRDLDTVLRLLERRPQLAALTNEERRDVALHICQLLMVDRATVRREALKEGEKKAMKALNKKGRS